MHLFSTKNENDTLRPCLPSRYSVFLSQTIQNQIILLFVNGRWSKMGQTLTETNKTRPCETMKADMKAITARAPVGKQHMELT